MFGNIECKCVLKEFLVYWIEFLMWYCRVCKLFSFFNNIFLCFGFNLIFRCLEWKGFIIMIFFENFKILVVIVF